MVKYFLFLTAAVGLFSCNNSDEFELCNTSLHPYYYPELKYEGDFYAIKKHFKEYYQPVLASDNSGIIRIRFQVNCKGESGNYNIETYDFNFKITQINKEITTQLLELTKSLDGWIPARNDDGKRVNSHKFLAFKVENGNLIEIMPK